MDISPITFEIINNAMVAINDEAAATVRFVSGSPVATDVFDYNTGLLTAEGDVFATGIYISIHAISLEY
ncbi:MAG: hydantoinase B/oxoprolinase family protein, partial [Dehalococcoidia bacterium]|nr:hydantoinase B/oxoprolinase family protein [Dehalococcoidia bacterium]